MRIQDPKSLEDLNFWRHSLGTLWLVCSHWLRTDSNALSLGIPREADSVSIFQPKAHSANFPCARLLPVSLRCLCSSKNISILIHYVRKIFPTGRSFKKNWDKTFGEGENSMSPDEVVWLCLHMHVLTWFARTAKV